MWRKCSMDETVPIKLESSTCVKEIITTFFFSVHSCFCCDRCPYCNDSSETWIETPFVPNTTGFLSCFFGPTMPCFFQTVLSPFYSSEDLTCRASTFQRLPLEEGTAGLWLATQCSMADGPTGARSAHHRSCDAARGTNHYGSVRPLFMSLFRWLGALESLHSNGWDHKIG